MVPGTWVPAAPVGGPTSAPASSDDASTPWARGFASEISRLRSRGVTYAQSADFLREIVRRASLRFTDIRDDPRRFFLAHRLLAAHAPAHGPGFWIRFTVQFNLFAGTVVALGGPAHLRRLDAIQAAGELGCFCLTERLAGVNSGLVVNTTASYDPASRTFVLRSPNEGACKNWISQGLTAEWAVVVADLTTGGRRVGPHGFLVRLRDARDGPARRGVTVGDMGEKTTGVDLDNAWVRFTECRVPHECLLDRHGGVDAATGAYVTRGAEKNAKKPMEMIGQRLFTGRVAVAQAALVFSRALFAKTRQYSDGKMCAMRGATPRLSDVPQLRALYDEADARFARMESFAEACETELCAALASDAPPPPAATRAIAVAKIRAVETCVELCHRLKQEVGSYALMADTGFEHTDFLQCCKFAEGDSRILSQKLARDAFGEWLRNEKKHFSGVPQPPPGWSPQETRACARVAAAIQAAEKKGASKIEAWDAAWRDVYALADAVCARAMAGTLGETIDAKL